MQSEFYSEAPQFKYAQAWSMIYFFLHYEEGKYSKFLDDYIQCLKDGNTPRKAYAETFGKLRMEVIESEWLDFVRGLN